MHHVPGWPAFVCSSLASMLLVTACGKAVDRGSGGDDDGAGVDAGPDTGDEICFNGIDDDEDDEVDCGDPNCGEVARCVPVSEALGLEAGALVEADQPCPAGFEGGEVIVNQGLGPGACEGCTCLGATDCAGAVFYYLSEKECAGDTDLTGGTPAAAPVTFDCTGDPIYDSYTFGMRAVLTPTASCAVDGAAAPGAPSWERSMKFCVASEFGAGCAANEVCVKKTAAPEAQCALARGEVGCAGFETSETDWYTGVDSDSDTRTCGDCSCLASGGDCAGVAVQSGSDYTCGAQPEELSDGEKTCWQVYSPPVQLVGTSTAADCSAEAPLSGEIAPSGRQTLCCAVE